MCKRIKAIEKALIALVATILLALLSIRAAWWRIPGKTQAQTGRQAREKVEALAKKLEAAYLKLDPSLSLEDMKRFISDPGYSDRFHDVEHWLWAIEEYGEDAAPAAPIITCILFGPDRCNSGGDLSLHSEAVAVLTKIGRPAVPYLSMLLQHKFDAFGYVFDALEALNPEGEVPRLMFCVLHETGAPTPQEFRLEAARKLGLRGPGAAVAIPALMKALEKERDDRSRAVILDAIAKIDATALRNVRRAEE